MVPHPIGSRIMPGARPLRVGLLAKGERQPAWVVEMVRHIMAQPGAVVAGVFLYGPEPSPIRMRAERLGRRLIGWYRRWVPDPRQVPLGPAPGPHADESEDASRLWGACPVHRVRALRHDGAWSCDEATAARLRAEELDVIVLLGTDRWRGSALASARWGIWSVMPGDRHAYPGSPAGVWEVIDQQTATTCTLEILAEDVAAPIVLQRAATATCRWSIRASWNLMFWHAAPMVARALSELWRDGEDMFTRRRSVGDASATTGPRRAYGPPAPAEIREFVQRQRALIDSEQAIDTTMLRQWILLYRRAADAGSFDLAGFTRFAPPPDRVWADPFVVQRGGRHVVLFEEHILARPHAHLCAMFVEPDGSFSVPEVVLERPYHLSYPFVFEYQGAWYMIPETRGNRAVELYRSDDFPRRWVFCRTLLADVDAVDATLWSEDGRWWMFVGINDRRGPYAWTDLHLFYTDDPVRGAWTPHKMNPVVADVRCARPAGRLYRRNGRLFRPAQDGSVRYGYGLRIQEVLSLSIDDYAEREAAVIEPTWAPDLCGVHTINRDGDLTFADARIVRTRADDRRSAMVDGQGR